MPDTILVLSGWLIVVIVSTETVTLSKETKIDFQTLQSNSNEINIEMKYTNEINIES